MLVSNWISCGCASETGLVVFLTAATVSTSIVIKKKTKKNDMRFSGFNCRQDILVKLEMIKTHFFVPTEAHMVAAVRNPTIRVSNAQVHLQ